LQTAKAAGESGFLPAPFSQRRYQALHKEIALFSNSQLFSSVTKAIFESQLAALNVVTTTAFDGVEKMISLNRASTKESSSEFAFAVKQSSHAKDAKEFFALAAAHAQSNAQEMMSYSRHLTNIVSSNQAEFTKAAEAQFTETSRKVTALVDAIAKNTPASSEHSVAILKSAIGNAKAGYEQLTMVTKHAVVPADAHVAKATDQLSAP
jgi:phasin family protein